MLHNFKGTDVNSVLPRILDKIMDKGDEVGSRGGSRVKEITHVGITLTEPWRREILLPSRKANLAAQIAETMWVMSGRTDIEWLSHYLPRAKDFSDDGETWRAGYGQRLRLWSQGLHPSGEALTPQVDQLAEVVRLLKDDPLTRRAVMSIWDPAVDFQESADIPCNNWLSFSNRLGKLDLMVAIRSNDAIWGWSGINAFEWSFLLELVARLVGVETGSLHFATTSLHVYDKHWAKAVKIAEDVVAAPKPEKRHVRFDEYKMVNSLDDFDKLAERWFEVEHMVRTGDSEADGAINNFPDNLLRCWLRVLQWWWSGGTNTEALETLSNTSLHQAVQVGLQPKKPEPIKPPVSDFLTAAFALHEEKHAAYGDSWKRRGELFSIIPNIARKVDRLGQGETSDETSADTAMDLMIYLAKYQTWLTEKSFRDQKGLSSDPEAAHRVLRGIERGAGLAPRQSVLEDALKDTFEGHLLPAVEAKTSGARPIFVEDMLRQAYLLAKTLWEREQQDQYRGADSADVADPHSFTRRKYGTDCTVCGLAQEGHK